MTSLKKVSYSDQRDISAMKKLLISTQNPGKMQEYEAIFTPLGVQLLSLADMNISQQVDESGSTFQQNSLIKSYHGNKITGLPCLADDSGLEVDALDGEPGIYSARYGSENFTDTDRMNLVLRNMRDVHYNNRTARFVCCISIVGLSQDPLVSMGSISGIISQTPAGDQGFGYDPIFLLPSINKTLSELHPDYKNLISHRADASRKILMYLEKLKDVI